MQLKVEGRTVYQKEEVEWVERGVKVEVGTWKHVPDVRDSCHVQLGKRKRRFDERWGK